MNTHEPGSTHLLSSGSTESSGTSRQQVRSRRGSIRRPPPIDIHPIQSIRSNPSDPTKCMITCAPDTRPPVGLSSFLHVNELPAFRKKYMIALYRQAANLAPYGRRSECIRRLAVRDGHLIQYLIDVVILSSIVRALGAFGCSIVWSSSFGQSGQSL